MVRFGDPDEPNVGDTEQLSVADVSLDESTDTQSPGLNVPEPSQSSSTIPVADISIFDQTTNDALCISPGLNVSEPPPSSCSSVQNPSKSRNTVPAPSSTRTTVRGQSHTRTTVPVQSCTLTTVPGPSCSTASKNADVPMQDMELHEEPPRKNRRQAKSLLFLEMEKVGTPPEESSSDSS